MGGEHASGAWQGVGVLGAAVCLHAGCWLPCVAEFKLKLVESAGILTYVTSAPKWLKVARLAGSATGGTRG